MLVHLHGTPPWQLENSANIWNLLCLSRRLIICTEQTNIYISTFPNTLTSQWAKNHEISIYFLTNAFVALSRTAKTLKFKIHWFPDEASYGAEKL